MLVFGSPKQRCLLPGVSAQAGTRLRRGSLYRLRCPTLEETDTVLAVEPLDPGEGNFLNTAADAVPIDRSRRLAPLPAACWTARRCRAKRCRMPSSSSGIGRCWCHFHANDPNRQGPGFGQLDFHPILEALGRIDYRGWVSVEVFDYTPGVERLARESASYIKACLAEIAEED